MTLRRTQNNETSCDQDTVGTPETRIPRQALQQSLMTDETLPLTVTEAGTTKDKTVFIKVFARVRPLLPKEAKDQVTCKKVIETH